MSGEASFPQLDPAMMQSSYEDQDWMEVTLDNVAERLGSDYGLEVPPGMSTETREKEALLNFYFSYQVVQEQFGEEWTDVEEDFKTEANTALQIVDISYRKIGYHDKSHPVNFAAAFMAQAVAMNEICKDVEHQERLSRFLRERMSRSKRLVEQDGQLMWRVGDIENGDLVDATKQFIEEYSAQQVSEGIVAALKHDMKELEAGTVNHEHAGAIALRQKEVIVQIAEPTDGDRTRKLTQTPSLFGAQMVYSTQYPIPEVRVIVPFAYLETPVCLDDGEDLDLTSDSISVRVLGECFAACDYLEMLGRESYVSEAWSETIGLFDDDDGKLKELEQLAVEGKRNDILEKFKDAPLFLLWAEDVQSNPRWILQVDLLGQMTNDAFPKIIKSEHTASEQLIQNSSLPEPLKKSFQIRYRNTEVLTQWEDEDSNHGELARRLARALLVTLQTEQYKDQIMGSDRKYTDQMLLLLRGVTNRERAIQRILLDEELQLKYVSPKDGVVTKVDRKAPGFSRFHPAVLEAARLYHQVAYA